MRVNTGYMRDMILKMSSISPDVANDDRKLIAKIWAEEGWDSHKSLYENLIRVSSPETIRRTRQKLVQEGKLKESNMVEQERFDDFIIAREDLGY